MWTTAKRSDPDETAYMRQPCLLSGYLPIQQRVDSKLSVLVYNCLRNLAPSYLMNTCQPVTRNLHRRRLRSAVRGDLIVPPTKTVRYCPRSFAVT